MFSNSSELRRCTLAFLLAMGTLLFGCRTVENHFIYNPSVYPDDWLEYSHTGIEDAWCVTEDGTRIHGLFARHPDPRAVILFAHGRKGNVTSLVDKLIPFVGQYQVSVLIFDYRGYGKSAGVPDEAGIYQDARAARKWLSTAADVREEEIVMMGRSLGAAVAIELAAQDGARGLIIENGFTSLSGFVKHHVPPFPADWILLSEFNSLDKIKSYKGPVLICHGKQDRVIPPEHGQALFEAAGGPKHLFRMDGGHEGDPSDAYENALDQFIDDVSAM